MKFIRRMKAFKIIQEKPVWKCWVLLAVLVIAAVFGVEMLSNRKALKYREDGLELQVTQNTKKGKRIVEYVFSEPHYVGKLRICGEFLEEQAYTLEYTFLNGFEAEETKRIKDRVYPYYSEAWSPVNQMVTSLKLTFPDAEKAEITQVQAVTVPEINGYRCVFVALVTGMAGCIFLFGKKLQKYLHWIFVVYAIGFGLLMNAGAGPKYTTWDEPVHFYNVYTLSYGENVEWNEAARILYEGGLPEVNTREELRLMKAYLDQRAEVSIGSEVSQNSFLKRDQYIYFPMAALFKLGRMAGLTFSNVYMLGRLGNLFLYVILGALAIRLSQKRKIVAAAVLMFPTSVFQASMYTYDGIIVAMLTLAGVLLANEVQRKTEKHSMAAVLGIIGLILLPSLIKPVYLPLLLFLLLLKKNRNRKITILFTGVLVAVVVVIMLMILLPSILAALDGDLMYGADIRGGETGVMAQLLSMVSHPLESIRLLVHQMLTMDNFRNLALAGMDDYLPTNLMLLNLGNLGCIKDEWSLILIPLLLLIFLVSPEKWEHDDTHKVKWISACSLLLCITAIWGAMYLFFTPVGASTIGGVQARYFIPLLFPIGFLLWNNRIELHVREVTYHKMVLYGVLLLMGQCVWQLVVVNRCS